MALAGFTSHANTFHDNTYLGGRDYISPELLELLENNKVENRGDGMDCLPNYPKLTELLPSFFGTCDTFELQKHSIFNHDRAWEFSSSPSLGASMLSFDNQNYLEDYQNDGVIEPNYLEFSTDNNISEEQLEWGYLDLDDFRDDEGVRGLHKRPRMDVDGIQSSKKQCVGSQRTPKPMVSKDPQSVVAKNRREKISERLKVLQDLVPNGTKVDLVTMLEKAINYVKFLQLQVKVLATDELWPENGEKAPEAGEVKEAIDAILASHIDSSTQINT